jgi:hypothetical protein
MTQVLYGDREALLRLIGDARFVSASDEKLDKHQLESLWRRRRVGVRENLAILNPPEPTKNFTPRAGSFLLFEKDKVPAAWQRWCEAAHIKPIACPPLDEKFVQAALTGGVDNVEFTKEAAGWYSAMAGTSLARMENELAKLALLGVTKVSKSKAVELIGGEEAVKAEKILRALGTQEALVLAQQVEPKKAIPLIVYLTKATENRTGSQHLALKAIRRGGDLVRFDYWTGVQMFVHYCYNLNRRGADEASLLLALLATCGVVAWSPD